MNADRANAVFAVVIAVLLAFAFAGMLIELGRARRRRRRRVPDVIEPYRRRRC